VAFTLLALQGVSEVIKRIGFLKGMLPASAVRHAKSH
jgi:TRAP-type mannitol/chloroaromatic compound transport system permease small subunit